MLRRTLGRHLLLTAAVAIVLSGLVAVGVWRFAQDESQRTADRVARQLAAAVLVPMSEADYRRPGGFVRQELIHDLQPFLGSGMVDRVKVSTVTGDSFRIAFSDEQRIEGTTGRIDPLLTQRLEGGEVIVTTMPHDAEHRYESALPGARLEVFFGFRDAGGSDTLLEVYVPVDTTATTRHAMVVLLPMVLVGLLLLALATIPLSFALARRMERDRADRRAACQYGLAAGTLARRDVAQALHSGVIPDLAGAGLLLEAVRERRADDLVVRSLLDRAHHLLAGDVHRLRTMLDELLPPPLGADLGTAIGELATRVCRKETGDSPAVDVEVVVSAELAVSDETATLLHRITEELLRNVRQHASATMVRVCMHTGPDGTELVVADDGVGFIRDRSRRRGHIGLIMIEHALTDVGGRIEIVTAPGAGTTVTIVVPAGTLPDAARHVSGRTVRSVP